MTHHPSHDAPTIRNATTLWDSPSLHPVHLDRAGLVAGWREALLAQAVLAGRTAGYRHHPQLLRFRNASQPLDMIGAYLGVLTGNVDQS